jgi:hypothetical protein
MGKDETISLMKSGHFRVFGKRKYERCTHAIPLRHAKTRAKKLRSTGQYLTRVDAHEGSYAVWIYRLPISEQIKVRKKGNIRIARITSDKAAYDYASSEIKKGRGINAKRSKSGTIKIRSWPMKKIPKPKITVKKFKKMTKKGLLRRLAREEIVTLAKVVGKVKVRASMYSNKTYEVSAEGWVNAVADEWNDDMTEVTSYYLSVSSSVDGIDLITRWSVDSIREGISQAKGDVGEAMGCAYYPNHAWQYHHEEYVDIIEAMSNKDVNYANFYDIAYDVLYDEGWRKHW